MKLMKSIVVDELPHDCRECVFNQNKFCIALTLSEDSCLPNHTFVQNNRTCRDINCPLRQRSAVQKLVQEAKNIDTAISRYQEKPKITMSESKDVIFEVEIPDLIIPASEQMFFNMDKVAEDALSKFSELNKSEPEQIECNKLTLEMWKHYVTIKNPTITHYVSPDEICTAFRGVKIVVNDTLDDGVVVAWRGANKK